MAPIRASKPANVESPIQISAIATNAPIATAWGRAMCVITADSGEPVRTYPWSCWLSDPGAAASKKLGSSSFCRPA